MTATAAAAYYATHSYDVWLRERAINGGNAFYFPRGEGTFLPSFRFIGLHRESLCERETRELVNDIFVWDNLAEFPEFALNEILPRAPKYKCYTIKLVARKFCTYFSPLKKKLAV